MNKWKFLNDKLEEWILVAMFIITVILVSLQVLFRYVFSFSFAWSEEIARYMLIWIAWIGASYAVHKQTHLRIDLVKNLFSKKIQSIIEIIALIIFFIMAMFLAVEGTNLLMKVQLTGQVSPTAKIPMWIVYLAVPLGGVLMCIRLIQQVLLILRPAVAKKEG